MATIAYVELNVFALIILFLIFIRTEKHLFDQKLFLTLICSNALLLILDSVMWIIDGTPGVIARYTNIIGSALYLASNPLPCILWGFYANFLIYRDEQKIKKLLIPFLIPALISTGLVISSCFNGCIFFIDQHNVYHRGKLFIILALICFAYLFHSLILIIIKQKQIEKKYFIPVLAFAIPPMIGGILQSLFYGLSLVWVCMTISAQIIFINIQNNQLYTDHLTGLYNRRQLDCYLQERIRNGHKKHLLAGMMIDVNSFKEINDRWGHSIGDRALIDTGQILTASFGKEDMICRYGGDEFVIIMEIRETSDLIKAVDKIKKNTEQFNHTKTTPYTINFSIGYAIYDFETNMTAEQFLKDIDSLMYQDKKKQTMKA